MSECQLCHTKTHLQELNGFDKHGQSKPYIICENCFGLVSEIALIMIEQLFKQVRKIGIDQK